MPSDTNNISGFLQGGGQLGDFIRKFDWSATPLGPPESWSADFKAGLDIMLNEIEKANVNSSASEIDASEASEALEGGELGTFEVDIKTGTAKWSDKTNEFLGLPRNEEISMEAFNKAIHPEDRPVRQRM